MEEMGYSETPHERQVTWSLMGAVVAFVLLMTFVVVWITALLIREQLGDARGTSLSGTPTLDGAAMSEIATLKSAKKAIPLLPITTQAPPADEPIQVDATWTPVPRSRYVRFLYFYVKPSRIELGECVQISWDTKFAVRLKLYRNGKLFLDDAQNSQTVQDCPEKTGYTVYRLTAWNAAEESNWIQLQVKVDEAP